MKLDENFEMLNNRPDTSIVILGYTDATGPAEYNQQLSERRAEAVYNYLESRGLSPSRMQTVGYGESRPVAENNTAQGRALNRRSEIQVMP